MTNSGRLNQVFTQINKRLKTNLDIEIISSFIENCYLSAHGGNAIIDKSYFDVAIVREKERGNFNRNLVSIDIAEGVVQWYFKTKSTETALKAFAQSSSKEKMIFLQKCKLMCLNQQKGLERKVEIRAEMQKMEKELKNIENDVLI